jgi:hypothetical protein
MTMEWIDMMFGGSIDNNIIWVTMPMRVLIKVQMAD